MKTPLARVVSAIFISSLVLLSFGIKVAAQDTYPYATAPKCPNCQVDPWGFYKRQCTSYAAWKATSFVSNFHNGMVGPSGNSGWFGNAHTWDNNAANIGFRVQSAPSAGATAVWESYHGGAGSVGHVAHVDSVANNTVYISEYNWNGGNGNYNTRNFPISSASAPLSYIVYNSCTPPTNSDWIIEHDCEITTNLIASKNVIINNNATLRIKSGGSLDIPMKTQKVVISAGSKLVIEPNAKLF